MKLLQRFIFVFLLIPFQLFCNNDFIYNPFKKNYGSLLDYKRFNMFNQFSVFSISSKHYSGSYGVYLNTIQYNINNNLSAYVHLGKKFNFNSDDSFKLDERKDYLTGGTLIYKTKSDLTLGIEYGATPSLLNTMHYSSINPFYSDLHYLDNINTGKNLKLWMNKGFKNTQINFYIHYQEIESVEK